MIVIENKDIFVKHINNSSGQGVNPDRWLESASSGIHRLGRFGEIPKPTVKSG